MEKIFRREFGGFLVYDKEKQTLDKLIKLKNYKNIVNFSSTQHILTPDYLVAPLRVYLELTKKCNLKCKMCVTNSGKKRYEELDAFSWNKTIEGLRKDGVFEIRFTGGEPTRRIGWEKLARKVKELDMRFSLTTNGVLDEYSLSELVKLNPEEIAISLDGAERTNDFLRGNRNHMKTVRTIERLLNRGCNVSINSLLSKHTSEEDIKYLLDFSKEKGVEVSFFHIRPIGRCADLPDSQINLPYLISINNYIFRLKKEIPTSRIRVSSPTLNGKVEKSFSFPASDGFYRLNILSDGSIYAGGCIPYVSKEAKEEYNLGNIKKEGYSILNIWNNSKRLKQQRRWLSKLRAKCDCCGQEGCPTFTTEMEVYSKQFGKNPFCIAKDK